MYCAICMWNRRAKHTKIFESNSNIRPLIKLLQGQRNFLHFRFFEISSLVTYRAIISNIKNNIIFKQSQIIQMISKTKHRPLNPKFERKSPIRMTCRNVTSHTARAKPTTKYTPYYLPLRLNIA